MFRYFGLVVCIVLRTVHCTEKFASAEYWDDAYSRGRYGEEYEWYDISWSDLRTHLDPFIPAQDTHTADILVSGCGNSPNSAQMAKDGFARRLVSVDVSSAVIESMREKHPDMEWVQSDSRKLAEFENSSFDFVFDKGALDALRGSKTSTNSEQLFAAYHRVLRDGGSAIIVSSCMEDECQPLLQKWFDKLEVVKLPKPNLEMLKARASRWGFEVREYDLLYIAKVATPKQMESHQDNHNDL